jgi:mannan endo-1,4-beta-mannosidase
LALGCAALCAAGLACAPPSPAPACDPLQAPPDDAFVRAQGGRLLLGDAPLPPLGTNLYYTVEDLARGDEAPLQVFDDARAMGMGVVRLWAFDAREGSPTALQRGPDALDEANLRALDRAVAEAGARGLRVILTLTNHWDDYGGLAAYERWFGLPDRAAALRDPRVRRALADYGGALAARVNTLTGRAYRDDPTILGWELVNEPRCEVEGCSPALTTAFLVEVAQDLRRAAPHHLIGVGDEGFLGGEVGMDGRALARSGAFDWVSVHVWPQHWGAWRDPDGQSAWRVARVTQAGRAWIAQGAQVAREADLPLVVGELGWNASEGDEAERAQVLGAWLDEARAQGADLSLVWSLADPRRPDYDGYTIRAGEDLATRAVLCDAARSR